MITKYLEEVITIYCNSCVKQIPKEEETYCASCGVPLCTKCANHCLTCGKSLCDSCYAENNYKCEDCHKPEENFNVIRRSHIEQYVGCPYSLYLQMVLGITPPMNQHAQVGVIVHNIIEQIQQKNIELQEALAMYQREVDEWNQKTDDSYSIITMEVEQNGIISINNFYDLPQISSDKTELEKNIIYSLNENLPSISCTLDRIDFKGDDIYITDWKTGKPMAGKKLVEDLQPPLYIYGVFAEYGKYPKTFTLQYLQKNKEIVYSQIDDKPIYEIKTSRSTYVLDIEEALKRTKNVLSKIKNNVFKMPTNETHIWRCKNLCWFGISGKCTGVQTEQWKKLNEMYENNKNKTLTGDTDA